MDTVAFVPTETQYRTYAQSLTTARDAVVDLMRPISDQMAIPPFNGGRGEQTLYTTLNVTSANVTAVLAELDAQIHEANRRASICEGYTQALSAHYRNPEANDSPRRPAAWVDFGW